MDVLGTTYDGLPKHQIIIPQHINPKEEIPYMGVKERIRFLFDDLETPWGKVVDITVLVLIVVACIVYVAQTYDLGASTRSALASIELVIGIAFTIEYVLRMWVAGNRFKHATNIYSIIDLVAILPVFIAFSNLQFLRVFRIFRVFRLMRFLENEHFFFGTITEEALIISRLVFTIFTIVFIAGGLILVAERDFNANINTFTDAIYFSIVTLTTVGFGDIVPLTQKGRVITMLIIVSGIIFIPLQLGKFLRRLVVTGGKTRSTCGKCGLTHHDIDAIHCKHCGALIYQETQGQ